jgi:hypothetical protein
VVNSAGGAGQRGRLAGQTGGTISGVPLGALPLQPRPAASWLPAHQLMHRALHRTLPAWMKLALATPLRAALRRASRTAAALSSTPTTRTSAQRAARLRPMLPVPQYRSSSTSPGRSAAAPATRPYSASACRVLVWKKLLAETCAGAGEGQGAAEAEGLAGARPAAAAGPPASLPAA